MRHLPCMCLPLCDLQMAFKYLGIVLFPLFIGYGVYALLYLEHKGWYSFMLSMCYGFLLTFGKYECLLLPSTCTCTCIMVSSNILYEMYVHLCTHTHIHVHKCTLSLSHSLTHSLTHTHTHACTRALIWSFFYVEYMYMYMYVCTNKYATTMKWKELACIPLPCIPMLVYIYMYMYMYMYVCYYMYMYNMYVCCTCIHVGTCTCKSFLWWGIYNMYVWHTWRSFTHTHTHSHTHTQGSSPWLPSCSLTTSWSQWHTYPGEC